MLFAAAFCNQRYMLLLTELGFLPCRCTVEAEGASYPISYPQTAFPPWRDKYHRGLRDGGRNRPCRGSCRGQCELKLSASVDRGYLMMLNTVYKVQCVLGKGWFSSVPLNSLPQMHAITPYLNIVM